MGEPTRAEILIELRREMKMRERVYPRWVAEGKMDQAAADHRIAAIKAACSDFEARYFGRQETLKL